MGVRRAGENVEAWGFRASQDSGEFLDREQVAQRWFVEEFTPVVRMLRAADLLGDRTDAEAYMAVAAERYRLIRTHEWSDEIIARLRERRGRAEALPATCRGQLVRFAPLAGSKTWIARASAHSSPSAPSLTPEAASSRATTPGRCPMSARPSHGRAPRARTRDGSESRVK